MTTPPSLESRLERVEQVIAALSREVAAIRVEFGARQGDAESSAVDEPLRAAKAPVVHSGIPKASYTSPEPRPRRRASDSNRLDVEGLIGRYGMLGIGVTASVAAVGTFLNWAIAHGYLRLTVGDRVLVGLGVAAALGAWGVRLRRRERSFGSSVLGLALVIVLVCAYTAGPGYHLVPIWLAFIGSAAVSWGLAVFARGEDDESLWCVAFGGATLAPFVTSDGTGNLFALVAYALFLCLSACFAISHRPWPVAWRVFYASTAVLCAASAQAASVQGTLGFFAAFALPLGVALAGVLPYARASRKRGALRWLMLLTLLVTFYAGTLIGLGSWRVAPAALGAAALWLLIVDRIGSVEQSTLLISSQSIGVEELHWIDIAGIPLAFTLAASTAATIVFPSTLVLGLATAMFLLFAWRRTMGTPRDAAAFACVASAFYLSIELRLEMPAARVVAFLVIVLATIGLHKARPSLSWLATGAMVLFVAMGVTVSALTARPPYTYLPFATEPSLAALCVTIALVAIARFWRWVFEATRQVLSGKPARSYVANLRNGLDVAIAAPWIWAFVWVLIELSMAYSQSTSTLLLVTYFAATAVASVAAGRSRRSARLRLTGLALAIIAAVTAVYGASTHFDSAMRIVAYLVTSVFLLGIAYWYRRPGPAAAHA